MTVPMHVFHSPAYTGAGYAFDTTRKAAWIADSLTHAPVPGVALAEPAPLTREQGARVHAARYAQAIETGHPRELAQSQGFVWDEGLWPAVLASNGGVVAAARAALDDGVAGSLSSGLHHARHDHGAGFCTFNGLVIAARAAMAAGARTVLVLDLDAHCGGGTQSLIEHDPTVWQLDVSVSPFDHYPGGGRARLEVVAQAADYLPAIARQLEQVAREWPAFELCLYNAGMDPDERCDVGGLAGITAAVLDERERMVFTWCRERALPVAFVMAGGYVGARLDRDGLVALHRRTLEHAAGPARRIGSPTRPR
jgi:acetoin utilization deacetylase AcuC-like enzyme